MKKFMAIFLPIFLCALLFTGCTVFSKKNQKQELAVYSFSGENELISVSNGIIVLEAQGDICYGGKLKVQPGRFENITAYSASIYLNAGNEKQVLVSSAVEDNTGRAMELSQEIGTISGAVFKDGDAANLVENLCFELKTIDDSGRQSTYQLPLEVTEITGGISQ